MAFSLLARFAAERARRAEVVMEALRIVGGRRLNGSLIAQGAKNAALPLLAASLLVDGPLRLQRVPRVGDVETLQGLLRALGAHVEDEPDGLSITTPSQGPCRAPRNWVRRMRASFCVLGPLLARRGRAVVPLPGGCRIGPRPVDLHLRGLATLGAELRVESGHVVARANRLRGGRVDLAGPRGSTVTGTANVLCAAVLARGVSVLEHAAREPEIVELVRFLNACGARIEGAGSARLIVAGVESLVGGDFRLMGDRIETATWLLAAAVTGGRVTVRKVAPEHLTAVLDLLVESGCEVTCAADAISLTAPARLRARDWDARPFPGLPTDVQPLWLAAMAVAEGRATVRDRVFPTRFGHVASLRRMGARMTSVGDAWQVTGCSGLRGAKVVTRDLRGGAALVLAALAAEGTSTITGLTHVDRGYEAIDARLAALGAQVERVRCAPEPSCRDGLLIH